MKEFNLGYLKKMTFRVLTLMIFFFSASLMHAQTDNPKVAKPQIGLEIERTVSVIDIEGKLYQNVKVFLKSNKPDNLFVTTHKVKVNIEDSEGNRIYKKTLKDAYLYIFPNGQIQVGRPRFDQIVIQQSSVRGSWIGEIREKEGIY